MAETIRDWTLTRTGDQTIRLEREGRGPLIIEHEAGMDADVLREYATTRVLEAELRDAGASGFDVDAAGAFTGNAGKAPKALREAYAAQLGESRLNQEMRERRRRLAERS